MTEAPSPVLPVLLGDLVDYAGLFPPAGLGMDETVSRFAGYLAGPHSWMLGRLVIPWGRRDEFLEAARPHMESDGAVLPWRLSLLIPELSCAEAIQTVVDEHRGFSVGAAEVGVADPAAASVRVESLELKVGSRQAIDLLPTVFDHLILLFPEAEIFVETVGELQRREVLEKVAYQRGRTGRGAGKIRTGGVTPDALLEGVEIVEFMLACRALQIPYKATAGLHHPLPAVRPLTYEADAPEGPMHGFLNVLVAAARAVAEAGTGSADLLPVLDHSTAPAVSEGSIDWFGTTTPLAALRAGRSMGCLSFGSCSFEEPVDELEDLGFNLTSENDRNG